jgi:hypothetical protein
MSQSSTMLDRREDRWGAPLHDRFNDIGETWGDASFGHQKINTAVSSIRFLSHGCKLLRLMLATEDAAGTLLHVHQLEQTEP